MQALTDGSTIDLDGGLLLADPSRSQEVYRLAQRALQVQPLCVPRRRGHARGVQPLARLSTPPQLMATRGAGTDGWRYD